jgi:two-component system sensor histidine kinase RegB
MQDSQHVTAASRRNLHRLCLLRWVALATMAGTIGVATLWLEQSLALGPLGAVLATATALNLWTWRRVRQRRPVGDRELFVHLLVDTGTLTGVLYLTGGWANPFVSLFLLPLVIAATILPARAAWTMAGATFVCYSLLGFFFVPLPHLHHGSTDFDLHVFGMWVSFTLSAGIIAYFVVRMAATLRDRDRQLAAERERTLRDQHVLAIGTLAAGAAHQLGTPLSTLAIALKELQLDRQNDPALCTDLERMRQQVGVCKNIISDLVAAAGQSRGESGKSEAVDAFLSHTLDDWRALRPGVEIAIAFDGPQPAPRILAEQSLRHTLVTLLNNAADASKDGIELVGSWSAESLAVEIRDTGSGVPGRVLARAGRAPTSTKGPGHGIGLMIANAALERLGGRVTLTNRREGGACTRLELPLGALITHPA